MGTSTHSRKVLMPLEMDSNHCEALLPNSFILFCFCNCEKGGQTRPLKTPHMALTYFVFLLYCVGWVDRNVTTAFLGMAMEQSKSTHFLIGSSSQGSRAPTLFIYIFFYPYSSPGLLLWHFWCSSLLFILLCLVSPEFPWGHVEQGWEVQVFWILDCFLSSSFHRDVLRSWRSGIACDEMWVTWAQAQHPC